MCRCRAGHGCAHFGHDRRAGGLAVVNVRLFFFSSRRRHTRCSRDWSSDVCSSDLIHKVVTDLSANKNTNANKGKEKIWCRPGESESRRPLTPRTFLLLRKRKTPK